ncbi:hypothetical protein OGATHE_006666 [Ogataea polymorpha]|uniref:Uncharacterized protein n=1 Tax=Ogataea polymorpha TaxID=460523 RepID=A0A9P8SYL1_9ASCO|nr:hypothetical protein OGATHE_006666 [Ogataea polymorpha]
MVRMRSTNSTNLRVHLALSPSGGKCSEGLTELAVLLAISNPRLARSIASKASCSLFCWRCALNRSTRLLSDRNVSRIRNFSSSSILYRVDVTNPESTMESRILAKASLRWSESFCNASASSSRPSARVPVYMWLVASLWAGDGEEGIASLCTFCRSSSGVTGRSSVAWNSHVLTAFIATSFFRA